MQLFKPVIISDSLHDALAQIGQMRERLKVSHTYNGRPLTPKTRAKLLATLDDMEQDEIKHAREREQERLIQAKERLELAIIERTASLADGANAAQTLAASVSRFISAHARAFDAARDVGAELPDTKADLQKLAQTAADALKPLSAIIDGK